MLLYQFCNNKETVQQVIYYFKLYLKEYIIPYPTIFKSILQIIFMYSSISDSIYTILNLCESYMQCINPLFSIKNCCIDKEIYILLKNKIRDDILYDDEFVLYKIDKNIYTAFYRVIWIHLKQIIKSNLNEENIDNKEIIKRDIKVSYILIILYYNKKFNIPNNCISGLYKIYSLLCNKVNTFWKTELNKIDNDNEIYDLFWILILLLITVYKLINTNEIINIPTSLFNSFSKLSKNLIQFEKKYYKSKEISNILDKYIGDIKPFKSIHKTKHRNKRLHSRNPIIDEMLESDNGSDGYADLEDFIAWDSE